MRILLVLLIAMFLTAVPVASGAAAITWTPQIAQPQAAVQILSSTASLQADAEDRSTAGKKVRFSFVGQPWSDVIPWFADEAGFTLQHVERWPKGSFNLQDSEAYSMLEALDQLNRTLAGLDEPFTLIRNRKTLLLKPASASINDDLIEVVPVADLDRRGAYEIMTVAFDLGDLDSDELQGELRDLVSERNRDHFHVTPSANRIQVRETGQRLRNIRDTIAAALARQESLKMRTIQYKLKFQEPETFISLVGGNFGIARGKSANEAGTFMIQSETLGDRLFVTGNNATLAEFEKLAKLIDSDPYDVAEDAVIDPPYIQTYPISIDPKLAFQILETMLEGREVRMGQDEITGAITLQGRKDDHQIVVDSLASVSNSKTSNFEIIQLEKIGATEALSILQSVYRQNPLATSEEATGPVLLANASLNTVIVSGTVKEVADTRANLEKLDRNYVPLESGPRTSVRIIPMSEEDKNRLVPMLPDLLGSVGRTNPFKVIRPEDRKSLPQRVRNGEFRSPQPDALPDDLDDLLPESGFVSPKPNAPKNPKTSFFKAKSSLDANWLAWAFLAASPESLIVAMPAIVQVDANDDPETVDRDLGYRAAEANESVNGAMIEFRLTEFGLTIESDDLDAADDIEAAIQDFLGAEGTAQAPTIFEIKHRPAEEMKQLLEENLGIAEPAGGDGGGGGLLGGALNNVLGGGGDLVGSLLGGPTGTTGLALVEGDITFVVDARFNHIWVHGATDNDLISINNMIDRLDLPEGETKPEVGGKTRIIRVLHRDAAELIEIVKGQRPEIIFSETPQQGRNGELAEISEAVQSLTGGGRGRRANNPNTDAMKPKVKLTTDAINNQIIVTGPEYLYHEIATLVRELDIEPPGQLTEIVPRVPSFLLDSLRRKFPGKLQFGEEADTADASSGGNAQNQNQRDDRSQVQRLQQQAQRAIQQRLQQQQNQNRTGGAGQPRSGRQGAGGRQGGGGGGGRPGGRN